MMNHSEVRKTRLSPADLFDVDGPLLHRKATFYLSTNFFGMHVMFLWLTVFTQLLYNDVWTRVAFTCRAILKSNHL